jgi:hypothetical protein
MEENKEYFLSTIGEDGRFIVYKSLSFSEIDIINLIRICIIERRNKPIGIKIIKVYEDSTEKRIEQTRKKLKEIGIEKDDIEKSTGKFTSK